MGWEDGWRFEEERAIEFNSEGWGRRRGRRDKGHVPIKQEKEEERMHVFEREDRKMMMIGTKRKRKEGKEKDKGRLFPTAPPKGKKKAGKRFLASRTKKKKNKKGRKFPQECIHGATDLWSMIFGKKKSSSCLTRFGK